MSPRKVSPQRARLGERLRELRATRFRSGAAMAHHSDEDLDAWVAATEVGPVNLRVLPSAAPSPILPLGGFSIHDDETLWLETLTREVRSTDPEEIPAHTAAFELAREAAAAGPDAVALIQRVAAELRDRSVTSPRNVGESD